MSNRNAAGGTHARDDGDAPTDEESSDQAQTRGHEPALTGFQRDVLRMVASRGPCKGLDVKRGLTDLYSEEVNHGRLYPNLDELTTRGYISKQRGEPDRRSNQYELTAVGDEWVRMKADVFGDLAATVGTEVAADGGER